MNFQKPRKPTEIPPHIKIQKCPPSDGTGGKSTYHLAKREERQLENAEENKRRLERFRQAMAAGMSVPEASVFALGTDDLKKHIPPVPPKPVVSNSKPTGMDIPGMGHVESVACGKCGHQMHSVEEIQAHLATHPREP